MSTLSKRTVRDVVVFALGAAIATSVLVGVYIFTDVRVPDKELLSNFPAQHTEIDAETVVEELPSSPQSNQGVNFDNVVSINNIIANYSGSFNRFAALYSLVAQSDERALVELFNETLNYEFNVSDETTGLPRGIRTTILSKLVYVNEELARSMFLGLDTNKQRSCAYVFARELARIDRDRAVKFVNKLDRNVKINGSRGILDLNSGLSYEDLNALATDLNNEGYVHALISRGKLEEDTENPQKAWASLSAEPDFLSDKNWSRINNIVEAWIKKDGISILDTVTAEVEDKRVKERIIRTGLNVITEDNPLAAFEYALQFETSSGGMFGASFSYNPYMYMILSTWAETQPLDALARLQDLESRTLRNRYVDNVFRAWARKDVRDLIVAIPQLPSEFRDEARVRSVALLSNDSKDNSIDEALTLLADIDSEVQKNQAATELVSSWGEKDPEAALYWAQTDPITESIRSQTTHALLTSLAHKDPQRAFDIARDLPVNADGVGLEASVISSMVNTNIDKALELLPRVRTGETQTSAYLGVGRVLTTQGSLDKALKLGEDLSDDDQSKYYTTVAMQAIIMDKRSDTYSDEEIEKLRDYVPENHLKALEKGFEKMDAAPSNPFFGF